MQCPDQVLLLHLDSEIPSKLSEVLNDDTIGRIMSMGAVYLQVNTCGSDRSSVTDGIRPQSHTEKGPSLYLTTVHSWGEANHHIENLNGMNIYPCCLKSDGTPNVDKILIMVGGAAIAFSCSGGKFLSKSYSLGMSGILETIKGSFERPGTVISPAVFFTIPPLEDGVTVVQITSEDPESRKLAKAVDDLKKRGVNVISLNPDEVLLGEKNFPSDVVKGIAETFPVLLVTTAHKWSAACGTGGPLGASNLYSQYCQRCEGKDVETSDILRWVEIATSLFKHESKNYKPQGYKKK